MNKPKVYLCDAISHLTYKEMNEWRVKATQMFAECGIDVHIENPVHFYNFNMDKSTYTEREVMEFDLWLVKNCDIILFNLDYPDSIGSAIEVYAAHDNWNKPVIAFGGKDKFVHPWIELCVTKRCNTMEEAVDHIINFYLGNI